jgi:hypothetical protein
MDDYKLHVTLILFIQMTQVTSSLSLTFKNENENENYNFHFHFHFHFHLVFQRITALLDLLSFG